MKYYYMSTKDMGSIWWPPYLYIQRLIKEEVPITKELVKPEVALEYVKRGGKRVPQLEELLTQNSSIRTEYIKFLKLIR